MRLTIAEQLERLKLQPSRQKQSVYNIVFHSALNLGDDGEDHINFSEHGKTKLGRALCHTTGLPINHPIFGRFKTMLGFWNFILSPNKDDELRTLTGRPLHSLVNRLNRNSHSKDKNDNYHVRNFRAIILNTYYLRVMASPEIKQLLAECDLELDSYYIQSDNGLRMRYRNFKWYIPMLNELRAAVKEEREPDYELFMSDPELSIYHDVMPACVVDTIEARDRARKARQDKIERDRLAREAALLQKHIEQTTPAAETNAEVAVETVIGVQPLITNFKGIEPIVIVVGNNAGNSQAEAPVTDGQFTEFTSIPQGVLVYKDDKGNTQVEIPTLDPVTAGVVQIDPTADSVILETEVEDNSIDEPQPFAEDPTDEFAESAPAAAPVEDVAETVRRAAETQTEVGALGQKLMSLVKA